MHGMNRIPGNPTATAFHAVLRFPVERKAVSSDNTAMHPNIR
jgi:hypothetical protein